MSTEAHLALWLDAPLMSWGHDSHFNFRHTAQWPTKSGVIGLLAAALGRDKLEPARSAETDETIQRLAAVRMLAIGFRRRVAGETVPIGLLNDYHTVGGGYDPKTRPTDRLFVPATAKDRKPRPNPDVTHRQYLEDARFGVILSGPIEVLEPCAPALRNPRWGIWFGRKSCLPAAPVLAGFRHDFEAAWSDLVHVASFDEATRPVLQSFDRCADFTSETEVANLDSSVEWVAHLDAWNDHPVRFGPANHDRGFTRRRLVEIRTRR